MKRFKSKRWDDYDVIDNHLLQRYNNCECGKFIKSDENTGCKKCTKEPMYLEVSSPKECRNIARNLERNKVLKMIGYNQKDKNDDSISPIKKSNDN